MITSPAEVRALLQRQWNTHGCVAPLHIACWEIYDDNLAPYHNPFVFDEDHASSASSLSGSVSPGANS